MARKIVIDACCMLNLLATRREIEIVGALSLQLLDTPQTATESLTLWTPPHSDGQRSKEATSTEGLRQSGYLTTHPLDSEALVDAYITAAARIKDSDASCIALAGILSLPLLTDDRKERHIARELFPGIDLVSTLDVLAEAEATLGWSDAELRLVASDLRWRGNFAPPRKDPRGGWYDGLLTATR
jgi:hypothetical protein